MGGGCHSLGMYRQDKLVAVERDAFGRIRFDDDDPLDASGPVFEQRQFQDLRGCSRERKGRERQIDDGDSLPASHVRKGNINKDDVWWFWDEDPEAFSGRRWVAVAVRRSCKIWWWVPS